MSSLFDKLNLRPQERRLVVIVGIVVFVVLNFWLVIPMFGEYGRNQNRIDSARTKLKTFQDEINKKSTYEKELKKLEESGTPVPTEEAGLRLSQEVSSQAALSGVTITSMTQMQRSQSAGGKTNAFFDEAAVTVNVNCGEKEIIEFLWRLADRETLIRAKSMTLGPDPSRMRLQGQITLVKSFQRRPPPKASAAAIAAKPAASKSDGSTSAPPPDTKPPVATVKPSPAVPQTGPTPPAGPKPPPVTPRPSTGNQKAPVVPGTSPTPTPGTPRAIPGAPPGVPAPAPIPSPRGGTNRFRRSIPTPAQP